MTQAKTWLLVANNDTALLYDFTHQQDFSLLKDQLIKSFDYPEGKLKNSELGTDEPGRYRAMAAPTSAYNPDTSRHQIELAHFARLINEYLLAERLANHFEHLIVCAEPHFLGILDSHFAKQVNASVKERVHKDYIPLVKHSFNEFIERLKQDSL